MTLPASGSLSLSQVNVELDRPANAALSLGDVEVRRMARKLSGSASMSDLRGRGKTLQMTAGGSIAYVGYTLYGSPPLGSLAVTTYRGITVSTVADGGITQGRELVLLGNHTASWPFSQVRVNGAAFLDSATASRQYFSDGNYTLFSRPGPFGFASGQTYFVEFLS